MGYLYNGARLQPDYLTGFTPDATTAAIVPGLAYQPLPNFDGSTREYFDVGPYADGFLMRDPYGRTQEFFDGAMLWNRNGTSPEVTKLINGSDFGITQLSQLTQWQAGQTPFPPNMKFPAQYPAFMGTPASPIGSGAELGLAGIPYGYGAMGMGMGMGMGMMPNSQIGSPMMQTPQGVTPAVPGPGVMPPPVR
jgi:hypothetical protein